MKTKRRAASKKVVLSIQEETINCMVEVARLFPNQDPIRLAAGVVEFKLPIRKTLAVLSALAPHFKEPQADLIRLAAGYNSIAEKVASERKEIIAKKVAKQLKGNL